MIRIISNKQYQTLIDINDSVERLQQENNDLFGKLSKTTAQCEKLQAELAESQQWATQLQIQNDVQNRLVSNLLKKIDKAREELR